MKKSLVFAVIVVGFSSILTQILVLRESISGFYGNELILGIILGNWLLLTGIGSFLGRYIAKLRNKIKFYIILQLLIAFIAPLTIFLIKIIRNFIAVPGQLLSLPLVFFLSFFILLLFCVIAGFQFTLGASIFAEKKQKAFQVTNVYILDNIGDMLGGLIFSYFLVFILNSFQAVSIILFVNLLSVFLLSKSANIKRLRNAAIVLAFFSLIFFSVFNLQKISTNLQYPNQKYVFEKNSIYGHLVVTERDNQLNFYENGFPLFNTGNIFFNEERTHYAMLQSDNPKDILLISGGVSGTVNEILKYDVDKIDYIELDPEIIKIGKKFTTNLGQKKINVYNIDGRLFVKRTNNKYDVVIIDLPDPTSVQVNRFYTLEFFKELKGILKKNGVISLRLTGAENYLSSQAKSLNSAIYQTLQSVFSNIIIIPGTTVFYIASDGDIDYNYKEKLIEKNIQTKFIENYLDGILTEDRIDYINNAVKEKIKINKDFKPISHYYYLQYWLSLFNVGYGFIIFLILIIALIVLYLIRLRPVPFTIFVTGFSGISLTVVIIVAFQILYGYVYHQIGIIITAFMFGLIIGAFFANRIIKKKKVFNRTLSKFDFLMVTYSVLLPILIILLSKLKDKFAVFFSAQVLIPFFTILIGLLVGIEFPIAIKLMIKGKAEKPTALLYSSDLAGACIGAYIVSVLLIPLFGIIAVSLIVGGLNLISGLYLWLRN